MDIYSYDHVDTRDFVQGAGVREHSLYLQMKQRTRRDFEGEGVFTGLDARFLGFVHDELLQFLLVAVAELGKVEVGAYLGAAEIHVCEMFF